MIRLFVCIVAAVVLFTPLQADAQTTWFTYKGNPVVDHGPAGSWDQTMVQASRVMFKDSLYHMWYLGGISSSSPRIGYATSRDGVTWSKHASNPVLNADQAWESGGVVFAYVIFEDTVYRMWYQGASQPYRFGYATSPDGVHWAKYSANPVFGPVSWINTAEGVYYPCVIPDTGGTYHMWFGANWQIGYAHGSSPTTWVPTAGPVSPYGRFPRVLAKSGGGYEMWHNGGYQTSTDGITWINQTSNLTSLGSLTYNPLFDGAIYHLWYASGAIFQERVNYAVSPKGLKATVSPTGLVYVGEQVQIRVEVDSARGLSFSAQIKSSAGTSVDTVQLYDDGAHGDSLANDGIFANYWVPSDSVAYQIDLKLVIHDGLDFELNNLAALNVQYPDSTWFSATSGSSDLFLGVWFTSARTGTVVGGNWPTMNRGSILRTTNGGATWTTQFWPSAYLSGVCFADPLSGWVTGRNGTILHTTDGGLTWNQQRSGTTNNIDLVRCLGGSIVQAVGAFGTMLRTTDAGSHWTLQPSITSKHFYGMHFVDSLTGTAVGDAGTIVRTTNGGASWTVQSSGISNRLMGVFFVNRDTGMVVGLGGVMLRTTNGGIVWSLQPSVTTTGLGDVFFTSRDSGVVVGGDFGGTGTGGVIFSTVDGGETWASEPTPTTDALVKVFFCDCFTGTAVGRNGAIFRTIKRGTPIEETEVQSLPREITLHQNYPNPFNPSTVIKYTVGGARDAGRGLSNIKLVVYDLLGREVAVLADERKTPGSYEVSFNGSGLASGVYVYRMTAGSFVQSRAMVLLK